MSNKHTYVVKPDKIFESAFNMLRGGYPQKTFEDQIKGVNFRNSSEIITDKIIEKVLEKIPCSTDKITAVLPWRSALAFVPSLKKHNITNLYHINSKRNEETLETEVDFEEGNLQKDHHILILDPMLATGNTIIDAIKRLEEKKMQAKNILVVAILAAPEGIQKIKQHYPETRIIIGKLDEKLDEKGYIVPGLGDFGDKYFSDFRKKDTQELLDLSKLSKKGRQKITKRIKDNSVSEILNGLIERDRKDDKIDLENKKILIQKGLKRFKTTHRLVIDTGEITGIHNVINIIKDNITQKTKIISIEGKSGVGKSSTTIKLAKKLKAQIFSMGEIFRYLTLIQHTKEKIPQNIFSELTYRYKNKKLKLFHKETDIQKEYGKKLREQSIESSLPNIAKQYQKHVIKFTAHEMKKIQNLDITILIEGRSFTLDFLPSDLRVHLTADAPIRAERRWHD